ncbi:MAG: SsrA-binding protein, partial [Gammaproteobacteria bacterium]|nr:SsrA-binding protein [Gammaproteobacteria bacterium]
EISRIFNATQAKGFTCVATAMYWKGQRVKCEVALGKGKEQRDKRATVKDREWRREQGRVLKQSVND